MWGNWFSFYLIVLYALSFFFWPMDSKETIILSFFVQSIGVYFGAKILTAWTMDLFKNEKKR